VAVEAISWVGIRTERFEPMVSFLSDVMGLPTTHTDPDTSVHALPDGQLIEVLGPGDLGHQHFTTGPVPGFRVKDVRATAAVIEAGGGELVGQGTDIGNGVGWQHFRAPDGNLYEVVSGPFTPGPQQSDDSLRVRGLPWLGTAADDFDAMTSFLTAVLGHGSEFGEPGMQAFRLGGGSVFEVFGPGHHDHDFYGTEAHGPVVAFLVDDLERDWDRLVDAGAERVGEIAGGPDWGWAHVRLPDGNLYEILAPRPPRVD
jgi:predicted enzyme related to lactoylglutathione lyase